MYPRFTVFTPTYNRAYCLSNLFASLCKQSNKDFEWMIVDDGSTDDTEMLVKEWQSQEKSFDIVYRKVDNGGKPRAINFGVPLARGNYFFIVDSDDTLRPDAVEKIGQWCDEIDGDPTFVGVGAARGFPNGEYIKGVKPAVNAEGYVDANNLERAKYHLDADMCEAYKTEIFRRFPMAEWEGERFAPEQIAMNEMALAGYKVRWHADIIYICDYLDDGLTKGSQKLEAQNPMGYAMMYNHKLRYPGLGRWEKYHAACQHVALSLVGGNPGYILKSNQKMYTLLALPTGFVLACRRCRQYRAIKE